MTCSGDRSSWDRSLELAGTLGRCGLDVALATLGEPPSSDRLEEHVEPDLVHLHAYPFAAVPFWSPRLLEGHDCPVCRSRALGDDVASSGWERYRQAVGSALGEARRTSNGPRSS